MPGDYVFYILMNEKRTLILFAYLFPTADKAAHWAADHFQGLPGWQVVPVKVTQMYDA